MRMKKTIFVLLIGLQCVAPGLAPSAHQNISDLNSKTARQPVEFPLTSCDQFISLAPPALAANSTAAAPSIQLCSGGERVLLPALPAAGKSRGAQAKKDYPLNGYTTGNKSIDAFIIASAARNNLDPLLLYSIMHQESAFNPRAVSPRGARGLMQVIPATATRFGVRNLYNPERNIEAGARYLRFLFDTFEGDVGLALAAYNAGEGNVKRYLGQVPPFRETIKYVSEILQRYEAINNSPLPQTAGDVLISSAEIDTVTK
jgi:soluble lytic murein transglycosylase-like protein